MIKNIALIILICLLTNDISAATYTTTSTPGTWDIGGAPTITGDIIVNHDWSGYDAGDLANYEGTITINNGGYYKIGDIFSASATATIITGTTGNFKIGGSSTIFNGATIINNGHIEISGSLSNNDSWGGSGTYYIAGALAQNGSFGSNTLGTLPIELVSFTAKSIKHKTILNWTTATEINNEYFEIQKSINGNEFNTIGTVVGNGNSSILINYSYTDTNSETAYYRLKQVDFNNEFEYSPIVYVQTNNASISIIQKETSNQFLIDGSGVYQLSLLSTKGTLLYQQNISIEGSRAVTIPVSYTGVYLLRLENNSESSFKKGILAY